MTTAQGPYPVQYPVQFAVEYPDRPLNRLTSFFRIFVIIPIWIVLGTVSGATWQWAGGHSSMAYGGAGAGGLLFLGPLLMILFRQKYPRWWFDWNLELQRFINRVWTYLALMNDSYPSTDDRQWVQLDYAYPDAGTGLNRQGLGIVAWWLVYDRESGSLTGMRRRHGSKIMWVSNPANTAEDRACLVIIPDQRRPGTAFTSAGQ